MIETLKRKVFKGLAGMAAPSLLKFLARSQDYNVHNREALETVFEGPDNFILAFWHGQMLPMLFYFSHSSFDQSTFYTFISPHRDGEYITRAADGLGINAIRTSLRDRRLKALKEVFRIVREGHNLAITPDGPIGPAFEAKTGIVQMSRRFELPVLPVAALPTSARIFNSWDHFVFPYPFGSIEVEFADLVRFDTDQSEEEAARQLESTLVSLTRKVGRRSAIDAEYLRQLPTDR